MLDKHKPRSADVRVSASQHVAGLLPLLVEQPTRECANVCLGGRGAALRIEDVAAIVLGLLPALDAVPFQLSIDPAGPAGLMAAPAAPTAAAVAAASAALPAAGGTPVAGALLTQTADPQAATPGGKGGTANMVEPAPQRQSAGQQTAAAAAAPGKWLVPPPTAASSPAAAAAVPQPNGGFLASFGGLLSRRGGHAVALQPAAAAAASPSKGSRWAAEPSL